MHTKAKPIHREHVVKLSFQRIPQQGSVLPRLREPTEKTNAIGFMVTGDCNGTEI